MLFVLKDACGSSSTDVTDEYTRIRGYGNVPVPLYFHANEFVESVFVLLVQNDPAGSDRIERKRIIG